MKKVLPLLLTILTIFMFSGCVINSDKTSSAKIDALNTQIANLQNENKQLKAELDKAKEAPSPTPEPSPEASQEAPADTAKPSTAPEQASIPLKIVSVQLKKDVLNLPEINIIVQNTGKKAIDAFDISVECYDNYGERIKGFNVYDTFEGTYQGTDGAIQPGKKSKSIHWSMSAFDKTTKVRVAIVKCHEKDGETYELDPADCVWVEK